MGYTDFLINRLLSAIFVLVVASIVIFSILRLVPGNPAQIMLGQGASEQAVEAQYRQLGLHLPVYEQYIVWVIDIMTGNMGQSIATGQSIGALVMVRLPRSLFLAFLTIGLALLIAIPFGVTAATNRNSKIDYGALFFSQLGISIPGFVLGVLFIFVFAGIYNVLPSSGYVSPLVDPIDALRHAILPAITLAIINAAIFTRFVRSEMLEQLSGDYVLTARAMGHPESRIIRRFTLRNALIPTITVVGIQFAGLIGGLVVIEQVFSYPGMGLLILDALFARDYPVLQIGLLIVAATFIVVNLLVDIIYGYLDPKVKH